MVCSRALALSIDRAKALLRANYNYSTGHDINCIFNLDRDQNYVPNFQARIRCCCGSGC